MTAKEKWKNEHRLKRVAERPGIWKAVKIGREEYPYLVSNKGHVMNEKGQILKPYLRGQRKGTYPCIELWKYGKRFKIDVHRLVAIHHVENPDPHFKYEVNHLDCNQNNPMAKNLEWCTRSENEQHKRFMEAHLEFINDDVEQEVS